MRGIWRRAAIVGAIAIGSWLSGGARLVWADADPVQLSHTAGGWTLIRDGQPYFIKGAGGDASKQLLKNCGGNSFRTWGADGIDDKLAEAQSLGLSVTIGIWLGHEEQHFNYDADAAVEKQFERAKATIDQYKNNPALLVWAIGNEMEGYKQGDNPKIWAAVEQIAAYAHQVDKNHPTMTVIAEIGGKRVQSIDQYCPDIDIIGINSYGGSASLGARYRALGGQKPYVITEFGPAGTWEIGKNSWGAPTELTSTQKAAAYRKTYENSVAGEQGKLCLGSYVFAWGAKHEATATWFGLMLPDGTRLAPVDTMQELWSGKPPANPCPTIEPLKVDHDDVQPGDTIHVTLSTADPNNSPLAVKWDLEQDPGQYDTGGASLPESQKYPDAIVSSDLTGATLKMPTDGGGYWVYAFVYNDKGGAAMADAPLHVAGAPPAPKAPHVTMPFAIYGDGVKDPPYVWSGWMGKMEAIAMDDKCTDNPHSGTYCMKCSFNSPDGFGGIVWQNPVNDWGKQFGGFNLTGASKLTFWARGMEGGEVVDFKVGVIGRDQKYYDTTHASLEDVKLTNDWKQYSIDLTGRDLTDIKSGFAWTVAAHGDPVTFYLDDIQFEK
jgi:hypothetical protein